MSTRLTILGCGSSPGVPRVGGDWGVCDPTNPKNRRRRSAALIERRRAGRATTVLVDTGPDLREQLLFAEVRHIDGVLYTHEHADHTHGIDDLRAISARRDVHLPMYGSADTLDGLAQKFAYIFDDNIRPLPGTTKPQTRT